MTATEFTSYPEPSEASLSSTRAFLAESEEARNSRLWRLAWRTHFYAGIFSMPILVLMALTGLAILYTQPITRLIHGDLTRVATTATAPQTLDDQRAAVERANPGWVVAGVAPPQERDRSSMFALKRTEDFGKFPVQGPTKQVFVNPYTGRVKGAMVEGNDIVGLANRLHGTLNNADLTVSLPTYAGIAGDTDDKKVLQKIPVGEVVLEIFACWALVLAVTGLFLWWPRKKGAEKARFLPRRGQRGRARIRDLHAVSGIVLCGLLVFFVVTGLAWSSFWGENWRHVASNVTAGKSFEEPPSVVAKTGDLNRFGNPIPWALADAPVPASGGLAAVSPDGTGHTHHVDYEGITAGGRAASPGAEPGAALPARISLDAIQRIAKVEKMRSGYSVALPVDDTSDAEKPVYGSFVLSNPWPTRAHVERTLYVDQFSGKTLASVKASDSGELSYATSLGIELHMGTQFGLVNRIAMTGAVLALLFSVTTALMMWWRRRPTGTAGLPRRPADVRFRRGLAVVGVAMAVIYPLWGVSLLGVLVVDRVVIRRVPRLRAAFGIR